ncbi:unnamed protein product [Rotaria sp. Silwood2]|nr:unnamed protein product [Rotaria sp. Silwood2]CAF4036950.1 unnamed protein product [Rotaria sp. Silwood2]
MSKRFRCGRLLLTKDGTVKKLDLENGGGCRSCEWQNKDMTFDNVHHLLLNIFKLSNLTEKKIDNLIFRFSFYCFKADTELETSLYDFQLQPLNISQYQIFSEYINHYGLSCNSTVIYLCVHEANSNDTTKKYMIKKKTKLTTTTSTFEQETSIRTDTSSSITSIEYKHVVKNEQDFDQQQNYTASSEYSFINSINDLMKNIRELVCKNNFDENLIQLFENISIIHGYVRLTIDPLAKQIQKLKEYFQEIKQSGITLHSNCLNNILDICQSTTTLLVTKNKKCSLNQDYLMIVSSFTQFYQNVKTLHCQWFQCVENNDKSDTVSSSCINSIGQATSTSSHLNIQCLSQHTFKTNTETLSKENQENIVLFQQLLNCSRDLLNVMYSPRLSTFRTMMKSIILEIESIQSTIDIYNSESLCNAKNVVMSLKTRYTNKFSSDAFMSPTYQIARPVKQAYQKTLRAICDLITSLRRYQTKEVNNYRKSSNHSSTPLSITGREQWKNRQSNRSYKRKSENLHANNYSRNKTASHSSSGRPSLPQNTERVHKRKFDESD